MDRRDGMLLVDAMGGTNGDLEKLGPKKFRILPEIAGLGSKYHLAACWPTAGKNGCRSRSERRLLEWRKAFHRAQEFGGYCQVPECWSFHFFVVVNSLDVWTQRNECNSRLMQYGLKIEF